MMLTRGAVGLLRVLLVLLFLATVVGQTLSIPGELSSLAQADAPAIARLRWPLTVAAVVGMVCVQVVIVCTWRLLGMVRTDRIFSRDAFAWVDAILWALAVAWLLLAAGAGALVLTIYVTPEIRDPGIPMMLGGMVLVATVVVLLMVVMRALLRSATALRDDMDAVI
ncbi:DUF2975 domain-containing protein [Actinotalea sp. Marseille-Q4924]|uniref:DUF2975 domain-containing protein n=1 Tax=Actinotalea sp. Marseille-Q4924 TaxID=2866571 RepID=UPI001CE3CD42|nr:DUF2975 domain-containing protein [Actinotalea sp. Marseille-Q4924]